MNAGIEQRPASAQCAARLPLVFVARPSGVSENEASVRNFSQSACVDLAPRLLDPRIVAVVESDSQLPARGLRRRDDVATLLFVAPDRFLAENVLAGGEGGNSQVAGEMVRDGDLGQAIPTPRRSRT